MAQRTRCTEHKAQGNAQAPSYRKTHITHSDKIAAAEAIAKSIQIKLFAILLLLDYAFDFGRVCEIG